MENVNGYLLKFQLCLIGIGWHLEVWKNYNIPTEGGHQCSGTKKNQATFFKQLQTLWSLREVYSVQSVSSEWISALSNIFCRH
jgi:hypothetical protein